MSHGDIIVASLKTPMEDETEKCFQPPWPYFFTAWFLSVFLFVLVFTVGILTATKSRRDESFFREISPHLKYINHDISRHQDFDISINDLIEIKTPLPNSQSIILLTQKWKEIYCRQIYSNHVWSMAKDK